MTFKEARAEARKVNGAYIAKFKDGEWFGPMPRGDSRNIYWVDRAGTLFSITLAAKKFLKKNQKKPLTNNLIHDIIGL